MKLKMTDDNITIVRQYRTWKMADLGASSAAFVNANVRSSLRAE